MRVTHDKEANALYVYVSEKPIAKTKTVEGATFHIVIDYAEDETIVGYEFIPSTPINIFTYEDSNKSEIEID